MNFTEIAEIRQSCRSYDPSRDVEQEKLGRILAAARLAPSACNGQPYHITVCRGAAATRVAAAAQGLGTCILGWLDERAIRNICRLDGAVRLVITLGYAREGDPLRTKKRKDMDILVSFVKE